jgi:hypothetical protein
MSNIVIDIAAEFTGNKSFKQAESATDKLGKNVKKLAGALGLAFGGQQILAYGKAAVKAAAADEKAQKQLALALKNVGLGRDAASSEDYIQRLQSEFGILDDKLRPAYQTLAVATRNSSEAQRLLNLSLDIAAATGKDLSGVTGALSKAYLGNNTALSKLGVGISKADLKAGKFEDIIADLEVTFKGAATQSANTFQGSIDKLGVAAANASEIIGTGLIDALKGLGDQDSVDNLAKSMQDAATYTADVIRGIGVLIEKLKGLPGLGSLDVGMIPILGSWLEILNAAGKASKGGNGINAQGMAHLAELQAKYAAALLKTKTKLTAEEQKALKAARLKLAIDKANLALLKGEEVFDMDKIQIAAALTSQAEALSKATTDTQRLQVANDVARLNVKQSILALEDAIAAKDEAAIIAATNKLNADLKVLGALTGQKATMTDIESILKGLKPKDLIDQDNLDEALRKIREMIALLGQSAAQSKAKVPTSASLGSGIPAGDYIAPISTTGGSIGAILEYAEAAAARANAFADLLDMENASAASQMASTLDLESIARSSLLQGLAGGAGVSGAVSGSRYAAQAANAYNITIQAGIGDPEAIARAVEDVVRQSYQRGTSATGLLAV